MKIPTPITWALRVVGWSVGVLLIWIAFAFYAGLRLGHHIETCFNREPLQGGSEAGGSFTAAKDLVACLERESGWIEKPLLYFQKKPITSPDPVDCRYVGEWKASRPPNLVYAVTLRADRSFKAQPIVPRGGDVITGAWINQGGRLSWFYDAMPMWPPDSNPIRDQTGTGFTLVERDGNLTRYERVGAAAPGNCASGKAAP